MARCSTPGEFAGGVAQVKPKVDAIWPMKKKLPQKHQKWIDARSRHKLSHAQVQMARELGMNPERFGKLDNHDQENWKIPLGKFIEECYLEQFGNFPENVLSFEEKVKIEADKKAKKLADKLLAKTDSRQRE